MTETRSTSPLAARLIAEAREAFVAHPQYVGYFDDWEVATAKTDIHWRNKKAVFVARKGEALIFDPASVHVADGSTPYVGTDGRTYATFYSPSLGWEISLPVHRFKGDFTVAPTLPAERAL